MPGINLLCKYDTQFDHLNSEFIRIQNSMKHDTDYHSDILFKQGNNILGISKYNAYPIDIFESKEHFVIIEGKIYNKTSNRIENELRRISNFLSNSKNGIEEIVNKWILDSDGDYIVLIFDKVKNMFFIFNDALGRLPLYYYYKQESGNFVLSREVKFILNFMDKIKFNKLAIAEYLLFRYPLGKSTLIENVYRLEPAKLMQFNTVTGNLKIRTVHYWNFDNKNIENKNIKEEVNDLVELFLDACKHRKDSFKNFKHIISLSGGLDSRAVVAGLKEVNAVPTAVTYLDFEKNSQSDVYIAKKVAKTLNFDWKLFELAESDIKKIERLIFLKDGLNYAKMGFILDFFLKIKLSYGDKIVYYTGDGGSIKKPLLPCMPITCLDKLTDLIIANNTGDFDLNTINSLLDITADTMKGHIKDCISKYPEDSLKQKYIHFLMFEKGFKWQFEGEDRNRFYFWTIAPFYSIPLFDYAMNISDKHKRYYKLYKEFMEKLNQDCANLNTARWNIPITAKSIPIREIVFDFYIRYPNFRRVVKNIITNKRHEIYHNSALKNSLLYIINNYTSVNEYFFAPKVKELFNEGMNELQLFALATILFYMKNIQCLKNKTDSSMQQA
ncbi:MAG: asparagine synthase-related protein [Candidatus Hodarchaeota archaeon]